MFKELFSVSIVAAFCAMAVMVLMILFAGGGIASLLYGGVVLPFAYIFSLALGLPLLLLQKYLTLNKYTWLLIYIITGILGAALVIFTLGISTPFYGAGLLLTDGAMGMAAATGAWYFSVYRKGSSMRSRKGHAL